MKVRTMRHTPCHYMDRWEDVCRPDKIDCDRTLVVCVNREYKEKARRFAAYLHGLGQCVEYGVTCANLKRQLKHAHSHGILDVVIVGEDITCQYVPSRTEIRLPPAVTIEEIRKSQADVEKKAFAEHGIC